MTAMTRRTWQLSAPILLILLAGDCRGGRERGGPSAGARAPADSGAAPAVGAADFRDPAGPAWRAPAPAMFQASFETSKGDFVVEVHREWSPLGADRFYHLVESGYYDGVRFFRVIPGFMAQFGIHSDPTVSAIWRDRRIPDDPVRQSNVRGMISFATAGPNTRTVQVFINYRDNSRLDGMGFAPFGRVVEGMDVVDRLYPGYGEGAPQGRGPRQDRIEAEGNAYLGREFPNLDSVRRARIVTSSH